MIGAQVIYNSIKKIGKFILELDDKSKVELVEEDLIFETDKLWFLSEKDKSRGVLITKWNGKDINELIYN